MRKVVTCAVGSLVVLAAVPALANERRLTQTYESLVLEPGVKELELWVSPRIGRADYYVRFDNRVELELGLTDRLLTALYLNFSMRQAGAPRVDSLEGSVSSEWKLKLADPVADPVGLAVYAEGTFATTEAELEGKLIVDKRFDALLLAFNASVEHEWASEDGQAVRELSLVQSLGVSYEVTQRFSVGLEALDKMVFAEDGLRAGIYGGPVASYAGDGWWAAFSLTPQVASHKPSGVADHAERVDLVENERFIGRLLVGFHI